MRSLVADLFIVSGIAAQGFGVYTVAGHGWASVAVGTEILVIGLAGVLRK